MRNATWIVSAALLFLAAAKAHGRELRLERIAAGVREVVFGGTNAPFVESLWRAERLRFWVVMPLAAIALGAALRARGHDGWVSVLGGLAFGSSIAFTTLGAWSLGRAGGARGEHLGSFAWWGAVVVVGAVAALALPALKAAD